MARRKQSKATVALRAKVWLEVDGKYVFGLGICSILDAVDETGSIKRAAESVGKSYRHVWSRIKDVERTLGISLVETQVGGGHSRRSALTEPARQLVASYQQMREQVFALVDEQFSKSVQKMMDQSTGASTR